MERSTVLGCTAPYHLAQEGRVGGQSAACFLLSLSMPSCNCLDRINKSGGIQTRNRPAANWRILIASQVYNLATFGGPATILYRGC